MSNVQRASWLLTAQLHGADQAREQVRSLMDSLPRPVPMPRPGTVDGTVVAPSPEAARLHVDVRA